MSRLSRIVSNPAEKASLETNAYETWVSAVTAEKPDKNKIDLFYAREPKLKEIVEERANK